MGEETTWSRKTKKSARHPSTKTMLKILKLESGSLFLRVLRDLEMFACDPNFTVTNRIRNRACFPWEQKEKVGFADNLVSRIHMKPPTFYTHPTSIGLAQIDPQSLLHFLLACVLRRRGYYTGWKVLMSELNFGRNLPYLEQPWGRRLFSSSFRSGSKKSLFCEPPQEKIPKGCHHHHHHQPAGL